MENVGAFMFGCVLGWQVYLINRHRRDKVQLSDLSTILGVIGGAGVLKLFPSGSELFGWYGAGLAAGFFAYFVALLIMVGMSPAFGVEWFLDGRRKEPSKDERIPAPGEPGGGQTPMGRTPPLDD